MGLAELTGPDYTEGEIEIQRGRGPAEFTPDQDNVPGPPSPAKRNWGDRARCGLRNALPEPGRRRQPCGDPAANLPLQEPPVVLSRMSAFLARLPGDCLILLGRQMCTAGRGALCGIQPCPAWAWAIGGGHLSSSPGLHSCLSVRLWAGPWLPWAPVSFSLPNDEVLHSFVSHRPMVCPALC